MKIGILQAGHSPDELVGTHGDYDGHFHRLLDGHGFTFQTWAVVDGVFPDSPQEADGWLITGSRHGAYEALPWIPRLEALIRELHLAGVPLVGICFGHQIIAQALGGKVEKFPGGWAVGRQLYEMEGSEVALNAWHQDQVTERPRGAQVIARNAFCENAALLYGQTILTVQAHPEFDSGFVDGLIRTRGRGVVPEDLLAAATNRLADPIGNALLGDRIAGFFKQTVPA